MSNQQQDESLGVEQLPQTELDVSPGEGEEQNSNPGETHETDNHKADDTATDAAKQMPKQNHKNDN